MLSEREFLMLDALARAGMKGIGYHAEPVIIHQINTGRAKMFPDPQKPARVRVRLTQAGRDVLFEYRITDAAAIRALKE